MDDRLNKVTELIVDYSLEVKPGEKILINGIGIKSRPIVSQVVKKIFERSAYPILQFDDEELLKTIIANSSDEYLKLYFGNLKKQYLEADKFIRIGATENDYNFQNIEKQKLSRYLKAQSEITQIRINKPFVVLKYPTEMMAYKANMSSEEFRDFYFSVMLQDYRSLSIAMNKLKALMDQTDKVRIKTPRTDLSFSIKDIPTIVCDGKVNLPDGEVFTAPIKNSVNGHIQYNAITSYYGETFTDVYFEIENGKIIKATANNTEALNSILDTDEGARFFGEFAIGVNSAVKKPMNDILYDEKIAGSIHFTPGGAYKMTDNGNESKVHWDLVLMLTAEYGGGELYFDDVLIQKDGCFIDSNISLLNPEV